MYADGAGHHEQASRLVEVSTDVGFGQRWLDLGSGQVVGSGNPEARLTTADDAPAGEGPDPEGCR